MQGSLTRQLNRMVGTSQLQLVGAVTLGWQILPAASSSSLGLVWKGTRVTCKSPVSQLAPGNPGIQEAKQSKLLKCA